MKRKYVAVLIVTCVFSLSAGNTQAQMIPGLGDITNLIGRAIKAIDLKIQRMQNKTIGLQNAQKYIENAMTKLHLKDIAQWAGKQKALYEGYYQQLWRVKRVLTSYWQVKEIMERQQRLVHEYKNAWGRLKSDSHFTTTELRQMYKVYSGILEESLRNLDQLMIACSTLTTEMSDGQRMELIVAAGTYIEKNLTDLRSFNNSNVRLSLSRAISLADQLTTKRIYGIK